MEMWGADPKLTAILEEPFSIGAGMDIGAHYYFGTDNRRYYVGLSVQWMNLLKRDIDDIQKMGVKIHTGVRFGSDLSYKDLIDSGAGAVVIAIGTTVGTKMNIPNEFDNLYQPLAGL